MKKLIGKSLCVIISVMMILPCIPVSAAGEMKAGQDCLDLIKEVEGFSKYKYWDYSQWTIGYGTGVGADEYPDGITEAEAEELLVQSLSTYEGYVNNFADKYDISLKQNQFDALVSMTYNLGNIWGVYDEFDLKTYLINGSENYSFLEIAKGFGEWRMAGGSVLQGLVNRRQKETALFLSDRSDSKSEVWRVNDEDGVNLRKQPDQSSQKTGYMVMNTIFAVTEKKTTGDGMLWGKTYYEGQEQWCSLDYSKYMVGGPLNYEEGTVNPTESTGGGTGNMTEVSEEWKITSSDGIKLREGPGLNYKQTGFIGYNEKIKVTATAEADGYLWGKTTYNGLTGWCTLDYAERISDQELEGAALKSIYISSKPDKLTYKEGENLNISGIMVKAVYTDGSEKAVTDFMISGFESVEGTHSVTVTYMEKTSSFIVTVTAKELVGIEIESEPEKKIYKQGEGFSPKGLKVNGIYSNDTKSAIDDYYLNNIEGFSKTAGTKTIEVEYKGFKKYFTVEVSEKYVKDIEITKLPEKTSYVIGQELDLSGMVVEAVYDNGISEKITAYSAGGYNPQTEGEQEIKIGYSGIYKSFNVNVEKPDVYELPGDLDGSGARDIFDLITLNKYIDGKIVLDDEAKYAADVDGDGFIDVRDVEALSRIVSEQ